MVIERHASVGLSCSKQAMERSLRSWALEGLGKCSVEFCNACGRVLTESHWLRPNQVANTTMHLQGDQHQEPEPAVLVLLRSQKRSAAMIEDTFLVLC